MNSKDFYDCTEWKELRYVVKKLYGRRCMKCKKIPRYNHHTHVDHIKPRSIYPNLQLSINNLQILCKKCNKDKSNNYSIDYRTATHFKILSAFINELSLINRRAKNSNKEL